MAAGALFAALLLAGCGSTGLGDILGGSGSGNNVSELRGTIDQVDTSSRSILLRDVNNSMLSSGGGNTVRVYYDDRTTVQYQNQNYRPEDLERGDQVTVQADQSSNRLLATTMTVTYNANASGGSQQQYPSSGSNPTYNTSVRGIVRYVDTSRRTIQVDRNGYSNQPVTVEYDTNTAVRYSGSTYRPTDLQNGDDIDVQGRDLGNGRLLADTISVVRSVGGSNTGGIGSSTNMSTIRGTVRSIDTSRRMIELEQTSWIAGFRTNTGGTTMLVQYDTNLRVEYGGQFYPPTNLERGDVVDVQVQNYGNSSTYAAQRITLVRDVNTR